ncbi:MAG TPA: DUF2953 domain-containing protein [Firmicutes bacterium]|nr:DUF2953 domain-containing protein [Candidatus Fermentithermobacillaceae bacterium]
MKKTFDDAGSLWREGRFRIGGILTVVSTLVWRILAIVIFFIVAGSLAVFFLPVGIRLSGYVCIRGQLDEIVDQVSFHGSLSFCGSILGGAVRVIAGRGRPAEISVLGVRVKKFTGRRLEEKKLTAKRSGKKPQPVAPGKKEGRVPEGGRRGWGRFLSRDFKRWFEPELRGRVISTARSLLSAAHLSADADIVFGFGDPACTGMAYGVVSAFSGSVGLSGLRFSPNFEEEILLVRGSIETWVFPAALLWIIGKFLLSSEIRPLWREGMKKNRRAGTLAANRRK